MTLQPSGEDGVNQIKALLGLSDLEKVYNVFLYDNQMKLTFDKARTLFYEMIEKTKKIYR